MSAHLVRPAGAGHETLYVLLLCLLILTVAGAVVAWRHDAPDTTTLPAHQLDARRDLSAAEQGIYADLRAMLGWLYGYHGSWREMRFHDEPQFPWTHGPCRQRSLSGWSACSSSQCDTGTHCHGRGGKVR